MLMDVWFAQKRARAECVCSGGAPQLLTSYGSIHVDSDGFFHIRGIVANLVCCQGYLMYSLLWPRL